LGIDVIKAAEELSVDFTSGQVKRTVIPTRVSRDNCDAFGREPAKFAGWRQQERNEQE
jgi:hypothetical protein